MRKLKREIPSCLRLAIGHRFGRRTVVPASERPFTGVEHGHEHFLSFGFVGFNFAVAYSWRPILLMLSAGRIVFSGRGNGTPRDERS